MISTYIYTTSGGTEMNIRVRRATLPVWEKIEDIPPHDQDIAKRILWQPATINSSLGQWWWYAFNGDSTRKQVLINEEA